MNISAIYVLAFSTISLLPCWDTAAVSRCETINVNAAIEKSAIINDINKSWESIVQWCFEYEATPVERGSDRIPVHKIMAVRAPADLYVLAAHFPPSNPWQEDPFSQELFINNGTTCHRWTFSRSYSEGHIKAGDPVPGTVWMETILTIVPYWPLSNYRMPVYPGSQVPGLLADFIRSQQSRLIAGIDHIRGEDCVVLEYPGASKIWLAVNKSYCFMQRVLYSPHSSNVVELIVGDRLKEISPHCWIPMQLRQTVYSREKAGGTTLTTHENQIQIVNYSLNQNVPATVFLVAHRAGSIRYDDDGRFIQIYPGGEDLLLDICRFIRERGKLPTFRARYGAPLFTALSGSIFGIIAGFFFIRRGSFSPPQKSYSIDGKTVHRG